MVWLYEEDYRRKTWKERVCESYIRGARRRGKSGRGCLNIVKDALHGDILYPDSKIVCT